MNKHPIFFVLVILSFLIILGAFMFEAISVGFEQLLEQSGDSFISFILAPLLVGFVTLMTVYRPQDCTNSRLVLRNRHLKLQKDTLPPDTHELRPARYGIVVLLFAIGSACGVFSIQLKPLVIASVVFYVAAAILFIVTEVQVANHNR